MEKAEPTNTCMFSLLYFNAHSNNHSKYIAHSQMNHVSNTNIISKDYEY